MAALGEQRGQGVPDGARRVEAMVARHGAALLRVANQFSLCHDDALDAYQRGLEIYLRRLDSVDRADRGRMAAGRRQARGDGDPPRPPGVGRPRRRRPRRSVAAGLRDVEDVLAGGERVDRSVEALKALKPDEARALLLKAEGLSYQEIGKRFGWSYTKVNRSITEGRKRFLNVFGEIESGEACEAYGEVLSALAAGHRDERADGLDPPAPAPLRGLPGDRPRDALLARAPAGAVRPFAWLARLLSRPAGLRGLDRRRPVRPGGRRDRPVPERRRCRDCVMTGAIPAPRR